MSRRRIKDEDTHLIEMKPSRQTHRDRLQQEYSDISKEISERLEQYHDWNSSGRYKFKGTSQQLLNYIDELSATATLLRAKIHKMDHYLARQREGEQLGETLAQPRRWTLPMREVSEESDEEESTVTPYSPPPNTWFDESDSDTDSDTPVVVNPVPRITDDDESMVRTDVSEDEDPLRMSRGRGLGSSRGMITTSSRIRVSASTRRRRLPPRDPVTGRFLPRCK